MLTNRATLNNDGLIDADGGEIDVFSAQVNQTASGRINVHNGGVLWTSLGGIAGGEVDINDGTLKLGMSPSGFTSTLRFTGPTATLLCDSATQFSYVPTLDDPTTGSLILYNALAQWTEVGRIKLAGEYNAYDFLMTNGKRTFTHHDPEPPKITGTVSDEPVASGATIKPFATVRIEDRNYNYTAKVSATITLLDSDGKPTDLNGLLSGTGLSKSGAGQYTLAALDTWALQSQLTQLAFNPVAVPAGQNQKTLFDLTVTDTRAKLSSEDKKTSVLVLSPSLGPTAPLIFGTWGTQTAPSGETLKPFLGVTVSDTSPTKQTTATLTVRGGGGTLSGTGLIAKGNGVYTTAEGTPADVTNILQGVTFGPPKLDAGGANVETNIQLDVSDGALVAHDSQTTITDVAPAAPTPQAPVIIIVINNFKVTNTTTHTDQSAEGRAYTGPVAGIEHEYVNITSDSLSISCVTPNAFIHTGSGDDAIDVSSCDGTNVLDGATGSNFLVGGKGADTFFVDDRNAPSDIWSTLVNFGHGDAATIWGVNQRDFVPHWRDNDGADGYKGLTLGLTAPGRANATMTLAGYTKVDLDNGRLSVSFGRDSASGSDYMFVRAS